MWIYFLAGYRWVRPKMKEKIKCDTFLEIFKHYEFEDFLAVNGWVRPKMKERKKDVSVFLKYLNIMNWGAVVAVIVW